MKITTRCGDQAVGQLNEALLEGRDGKVIKLDKVRPDTTVVAANVAYPTDSWLLAKGVAKLTKSVAALKALGWTGGRGFGTAPARCDAGRMRSPPGCAAAVARPKTRFSCSPASWPPSPRLPSRTHRPWPQTPVGAAPSWCGSHR